MVEVIADGGVVHRDQWRHILHLNAGDRLTGVQHRVENDVFRNPDPERGLELLHARRLDGRAVRARNHAGIEKYARVRGLRAGADVRFRVDDLHVGQGDNGPRLVPNRPADRRRGRLCKGARNEQDKCQKPAIHPFASFVTASPAGECCSRTRLMRYATLQYADGFRPVRWRAAPSVRPHEIVPPLRKRPRAYGAARIARASEPKRPFREYDGFMSVSNGIPRARGERPGQVAASRCRSRIQLGRGPPVRYRLLGFALRFEHQRQVIVRRRVLGVELKGGFEVTRAPRPAGSAAPARSRGCCAPSDPLATLPKRGSRARWLRRIRLYG